MMLRGVKGFTLIEVLVALAVFGVLTALAYMTLGQSLNNADMLTERMDRLQSIQRTIRSRQHEDLFTHIVALDVRGCRARNDHGGDEHEKRRAADARFPHCVTAPSDSQSMRP